MITAYIKHYLRYAMSRMSILELNDLQKDINDLFRARCDMLMAEVCIDQKVRDRINSNHFVKRGAEIDQEIAVKSLIM